jgi:uncharacterized protein (DUF433 family)
VVAWSLPQVKDLSRKLTFLPKTEILTRMAAPFEEEPMTDRIETNPQVLRGKPIIRGTRIPVELILRKLSEGATEAKLRKTYPRLTREDIRAALRYAADLINCANGVSGESAGRERALEDDEEEQRVTWEFLQKALDEDRLSSRKLFP